MLSTGAIVALALLGALVAWQAAVYAAARVRGARFRKRWRGRHVLVTGGSKGLGLEVARRVASHGARVTIVARDEAALRAAKAEIEMAAAAAAGAERGAASPAPAASASDDALTAGAADAEAPACLALSADVLREDELREAVDRAERVMGPVWAVVPCAGRALPGYAFDEGDDADHRASMDLDFHAVRRTVALVAPGMMERGEGHVVLVSSVLALTAFIGYSTYCPAKAAVAALGHALRQELLPYGVRVCVAYPPGMRTPGFELEQLRKPAEAKALEEGEPVYDPRDTARAILGAVERGEYMISCGDLGTNLLVRLTTGMMPRGNGVADALLLPLLVLVGKVYAWAWDREVLRPRWEAGRRERLDALLLRRRARA